MRWVQFELRGQRDLSGSYSSVRGLASGAGRGNGPQERHGAPPQHWGAGGRPSPPASVTRGGLQALRSWNTWRTHALRGAGCLAVSLTPGIEQIQGKLATRLPAGRGQRTAGSWDAALGPANAPVGFPASPPQQGELRAGKGVSRLLRRELLKDTKPAVSMGHWPEGSVRPSQDGQGQRQRQGPGRGRRPTPAWLPRFVPSTRLAAGLLSAASTQGCPLPCQKLSGLCFSATNRLSTTCPNPHPHLSSRVKLHTSCFLAPLPSQS